MSAAAEAALRRDRIVVAASLAGLTLLAWLYLWIDAGRMGGMAAPAMPGMASPWSPGVLGLTFLMWAVMMVAMMLPSAAPAILFYAGLVRKRRASGSAAPDAWIFTAGYLAVWAAFSVAAALLQAALQQGMLLTPMLVSASPWLTGGLLVAAGIYQWLPLKEACLHKCRAPLQFFMFNWRPGLAGAFRMGAEHGAFCVGCCWTLMLLLFTAGVMNLLWVAVLAGFVLVEKLFTAGRLVGRVTGAGLILAAALSVAGVL